jgi:hypothetical protein
VQAYGLGLTYAVAEVDGAWVAIVALRVVLTAVELCDCLAAAKEADVIGAEVAIIALGVV